ncbi:mitochondrial 54S ribosomal protein YmL9 [Peziza echinospora]|nr:mitochondrial 54S ribosomal protein YmL9 [Peziza echinospora]
MGPSAIAASVRPPHLARTARAFGTTPAAAALGRPSQEKTTGYLLESSKAAALLRKQLPTRTGALAIKQGMSAIYTPTGKRIAVTVLQLDRVQVTAVKTVKDHDYWALQVGLGLRNARNISKPMLGHFYACGVSPKKVLHEFRVSGEAGLLPPGTIITPDHFIEGQHVDVRADCKGKGFAGGMKRHGFKGQPASHGNSLAHRIMGSSGQSQGGGSRVLPGKKMPGRMGGQQVTIQNLKVVQVVKDLGLVLVAGAVPGPNGAVVQIQDALKLPPPILS